MPRCALGCGTCYFCQADQALRQNERNNFVAELTEDGGVTDRGPRHLGVLEREAMQEILRTAPTRPGTHGARPRIYHDNERDYPDLPHGYGGLMEYPAKNYPYRGQRGGRAYDHRRRRVHPGFARIVTHGDREIVGMAVHPEDNDRTYVRLSEMTPGGSQLVYPPGSRGQPVRVPPGMPLAPPQGYRTPPPIGPHGERPPIEAFRRGHVPPADYFTAVPGRSSRSRSGSPGDDDGPGYETRVVSPRGR